MKYAYIKENIVVDIVDVEVESQLNLMDKTIQNIVELTGFSPEPQISWLFKDSRFIDPASPDAASLAARPKRISKLAFLNRFTNTELATYEAALANSILLRVLDKKLFASTYVDLSRQDTIDGVKALVQVGIITQTRAGQILNTEPIEIEIYKGLV